MFFGFLPQTVLDLLTESKINGMVCSFCGIILGKMKNHGPEKVIMR